MHCFDLIVIGFRNANRLTCLLVNSALHSWVIITMAKQTASLEAKSDKPSLVTTPYSSGRVRWKDVCLMEAIRISELLESLRQSCGADHFPVIIIQPATVAAFALLENLDGRQDSQEAFYKLCVVLRAAGRRFRVTQAVLQLLYKTAKENHFPLPEGCEQLLGEFNTTRGIDHGMTARINDMGLDYLLEKWDDLDLDEAF